jgi:CSLREA domain-containing protein
MKRIAVLTLALAFPLAARAATFVVNSTGDAADATPGNGVCATSGGVCTLRAAIQEANALAGNDTINFAIGTGPQTIAPATDLPAITGQLVIDGTTQPGSGTAPRIILDGAYARTVGIDDSSVTLTVRGLVIGGFTIAGIRTLQSGDTVTVESCYIGVAADGVTPMPNADGIWAKINDLGGSALIVGNATGGGNVISGNLDMGIELNDNGGAGAKLGTFTVQGNIIGLGADGMTAVPNLSGGIRTNLQFTTITVGGSAAGRNIISGNGGGGYLTASFFQADNFVFTDNYVGVAQDGTTPRGNHGTGAQLVGRKYTVERNIFAANIGSALIFATGDQPGTVKGNRIGIAADGSAAGNSGAGILVTSGNNLVIGGPAAGDPNLIANNVAPGIAVTGTGEAEIAENFISSNGGLGIDLGDNGVSANDALDADTQGGNNTQNFPTIATAVRSGGITFVTGALSAAASTSYKIRFFSSVAADPSGFGEGETSLGFVTVTTNASGTGSFNFSTPLGALGSFITATATNTGTGDTSEFSNALVVSAPPQFRFSAASGIVPESGIATLTIERNNSVTAASVNWSTVPGSATAADFTPSSGTVTFAVGQISRTIDIPITADTLDEIDESFSVALSNPTAGFEIGSPSSETVTIADDDSPPSVSIADGSAAEGNSGFTPMTFNVTLSAPSGKTITVDYATSNGTAIAGSDYAAAAGTLTFNPGETSKSVAVQIVGDTATELAETFNVTLSNPVSVTVADGSATGTINNDDGPPSITINDVAVVEGDSGTSTALFTLTLSGPSASTVTVNWSTSNGTATAGADYEAGSGTVSFPPNTTTATIAVTIDGDTLVENNETFFVDLSGPTNATLADAQGSGTIADDDGTPSLSINDPAVVEGVAATFTVTLAPASALPVTVSYATSDGSAAAGSDYTAASGTLTFAPGETTKTISVSTTNDAVAETSEQFTMTLSSPSGATIGDGTGAATIIDDDGAPRVTIGNAGNAEGNAGTSILTFTVDLSHPSASAVDVNWTTADGSAVAGSDYVAGAGTLTFAPGETSKTISVVVNGDTVVEPDETFFVQLTGATNATITDSEGVGTIVNDDGTVTVSIGDVSASEGTGGTTTFTFSVTLSAASSQAVAVQWATADGTALAGSDYTAGAGSLTFNPGETAKTISVTVNPDATFEAAETFVVNLLAATNAAILDNQALGTILNDDPAPLVPTVSAAAASVTEGNSGTASLVFAVTLDVATVNTVTVQYATGGGTATAGADYVPASGTLTFAPGVTSQNVTVAVVGDTLVEGDETLTLTLSAPSNATLGTATATGTIVDDDVAPAVPSISIAPVSVPEGNAGSTAMTFAVNLSVPTTATVTVNYATSNGTATAGSDYSATSGTLSFAPGVTLQNIVVPVIGDTAVEGNETFTVTLSSPTNGTLGTATATGTILDDDVAPAVPSISIAPVSVPEGNAGSTAMTFAVSLSVPTTATVTVNYATSNGTATAGSDYSATSGLLTFAPGVTLQNIVVPVVGDTAIEGNETFTVTLSSPTNGTLGTATATGTILDDDVAPAVPSISIAPVSVPEGNAGSTAMTFAVSLSVPTTATVTVNYATSNGTATAGSDYSATSGLLTFAPGVTVQNIVVPVIGDTAIEGNETFTVTLSSPTNGTLGTATATGTIVDDDSLRFVPTVTIGDVARDEGDAGATLFAFPVTLNAAGSAPVSVSWTTVNGTAIAGDDFIAASGTVVFAPGMTAQTITVAVNGDTDAETDETFTIQLSAPVNATLARAAAAGTIRNDDHAAPAVPRLTAAAVRVPEGAGEAVITLALSSFPSSAAAVRWMTRGGTATGGADFVESSGRVFFGSSTSATIRIPIVQDAIDEPDESFVVELFDAQGVILRDQEVEVTIVDDDDTAPQRAIVMAVGSLRGLANSRFGTAVQMVNFSDAPAAGALVVRPAGATDALRDVTIPYALGPRELRAFGDLLAEHGLQGLATLDVIPASGATPRMTVRIFDDGSGHGTTGFTLPTVTPADALVAGDATLLIAPDDPIAMRFNVGVRTLDGGASMNIDVRDRSGATRHTFTRDFAPNWFNQLAAADFAGIELQSGDYVVITITRGSAILYGAAVDNITNDPSVQVLMK